MGGAAKSVKKAFSNPIRGATAIGTFGTSELARKMPIGRTILEAPEKLSDSLFGTKYSDGVSDSTLGGGDFYITPEQVSRDRGLIDTENTAQMGLRKTRRQELADTLSRVADRQFMTELPNIAENANAGGIYTGTGFSEALAREKASNLRGIEDRLALQSLTDVDADIAGRDRSLSRQFSLEDFIRSANVAKSTGQALMPKTNGKAGTGETLQGAAALAKLFV